jgi:uncharacterized protein (TIGR02421 family)
MQTFDATCIDADVLGEASLCTRHYSTPRDKMRRMTHASEGSVQRPWRPYKERVFRLAQRIVEAQRPIRILNAIKWDPQTFEQFRDSKFRNPPHIDADSYAKMPLGFNPEAMVELLETIIRDIHNELGSDAIGGILSTTAQQYIDTVRMLELRGTPGFYSMSRTLYGSPKDLLPGGKTTLRAVAQDMYGILNGLDDAVLGPTPERTIDAPTAVSILGERLKHYFGQQQVNVILDDGIVADAAAGSDYIKIRQGALFSERDLRLLEVHEGWVHVATSLNGQAQPVARWLGIGPPRVAATQEGLAALLEVLTMTTHPGRARRMNDRVLAVDKAEDGASFLEVFEWFRTEGYDETTCFWNTQRVFRGGTTSGGSPFTKDIVYTRGIVTDFNFLTSAIAAGRADLIRWLFVGKVALEDIPILAEHAHEGLVRPPLHVPPMFRDLNGLAIWLAVSAFWGKLENEAIQRHFRDSWARLRNPDNA